MALELKSNPVASELILPTAFETAQCRFPKINRGRETALRCHLDPVDRAAGNEIKSKNLVEPKKSWISLRNIDAGFRHFDFAECAEEAQPRGFLTPRASKTGVISCPVNYPDSCRGGFTNNICQKRTISQTRPGNCIMGDRSDMISATSADDEDHWAGARF